jgi:hypothetical protein
MLPAIPIFNRIRWRGNAMKTLNTLLLVSVLSPALVHLYADRHGVQAAIRGDGDLVGAAGRTTA